tara:strand:- start:52625 stop:53221 length:597 start_codon:yes stop_codon:yes gene_type:complete
MITDNNGTWEDNMLNKFKYKDWTFVEYINPKKSYPNKRMTFDPTRPYNAIYTTGLSSEKKAYDRIINWFKHLEHNLPDVNEVWDALTDDEAAEWFKNSKPEFAKWWESLSIKLKHYYTDRLEKGKSLLPDDLVDTPGSKTGSLQMTVINDKLALSSNEITILDKAKEMIEAVRGVTSYEYRTTMREGEELHTYIFDLK